MVQAAPASIDALKVAGMSDAELAKIKALIGKTHLTEAKYDEALKAVLGEQDFARHRDALIAQARLPNDGGGPDTLAQLLLGPRRSLRNPYGRPLPRRPRPYDGVRSLLLEWQQPDGSWQAAGQLPSIKWSSPAEMNDATTLWSVLALNRCRRRRQRSCGESAPRASIAAGIEARHHDPVARPPRDRRSRLR